MGDKPELTRLRLRQDTEYLRQHPDDTGSPAYRDCLQWRFEHERFLTECLSLLRKATGDMPGVVCTARLKRMDSILKKIRRSQYTVRDMRDIAGCRVIVPDMRGLKEARERIEEAFRTESLDSQLKDYISQPEESGYRGVHWDLRRKGKPCDRAEVQLRTMKQHLWATTVETAGLLYGTDLKHAELGDDAHGETIAGLLRDISLCWIAADELGQRPNASDLERFRSELQKTETDDFFNGLGIFTPRYLYRDDIPEETETNSQNDRLYVLIFSLEGNTVRRQTFPMDRIEDAIEAFNQAEAAGSMAERKGADETADNQTAAMKDSVLIAAPDEKSLALAYPNYLGGSETCDDGFSLTKEAALKWIESWR